MTTMGRLAGRMAEAARPAIPSPRPRRVRVTAGFTRWMATLNPERREKITGAAALVAARGPTGGRPHVDVIHGSRLRKLKEVRIDRGVRVLFAFDSHGDAIMLLGGDKTGRWNRWYPEKIRQAVSLYAEHERSNGKEPHCLSQQRTRRTASHRSR